MIWSLLPGYTFRNIFHLTMLIFRKHQVSGGVKSMDRIRMLLEEKRFLETNDKALKMDSSDWEKRYMMVMEQISREERTLRGLSER